MPPDLHEEFEELCALSTTGELTAEEWARLKEHLTHCDKCNESMRLFERVVAMALPALAVEASPEHNGNSTQNSWSVEQAEARLMELLRDEPLPSDNHSTTPTKPSLWQFAWRYAAAAVLLAACGVAGYLVGTQQKRPMNSAVTPAASPAPNVPRPVDHPAVATVSPAAKSATQDNQTAALQSQLKLDQSEMAKLTETQSQLEAQLTKVNADLDHSVQDRADLSKQLAQAQASAQSLQARLNLANGQQPQDTAESLALKAQVNDLNTALQDKNKEIAKEQELLQHDRDIRNLIGARNLYIAEIYDVAKNGDTQKPFGRVFYTKDKSLIFYGYDLDQQHGVKNASTFQAWGSRGADRQHAVNLGLLYEDDASQKRWVLKFNDPKTIAQIDAVFVTVEPEGGSSKPSGKPLLFTYLHINPNHP